MPDFSMDQSYKLGRQISVFSKLPTSLNTEVVAQAMHDIDGVVAKVGAYTDLNQVERERFKGHIEKGANIVFPSMFSNQEGASVLLRLWAGCLWAAKSIALETRDGKNTPEDRRHQFENNIYPRCLEDDVFKLGVMSAPQFKEIRNNPVLFDGIPESIQSELNYD